MTTVIEIRHEEVPPRARCSLIVNGDELAVMGIDHNFKLANSIDTQFAGAWIDDQRLYDTEIWWVPLEGERRLSAYVPPRSADVDYSFDQLEEAQHGPT